MKDDATRQVVLGLMDQVGRLVKTKFPSCKVINTGDPFWPARGRGLKA
jgi:hypothetical protein